MHTHIAPLVNGQMIGGTLLLEMFILQVKGQRHCIMDVTLTLPPRQFMLDSPSEVAQKLKLYAAVAMYQTGELSIGAACEVANVDRYWFLEFLNKHNIPLQVQTPDELEAEFQAILQSK